MSVKRKPAPGALGNAKDASPAKKRRNDDAANASASLVKAKRTNTGSLNANASKETSKRMQNAETAPKTKAEKKAAKLDKKHKKKPIVGLVNQCVHIWEDLRPRDASSDAKRALVAQVVAKGKGSFKELALNHSAARVVQAVLKHGTPQDRHIVWADCKEHLVELSMSAYGNHVVRKLINTATKDELPGVVRAFKGHVTKLFRHPCGSAVLSDLYDELTGPERNVLVAEFYGREYALFGSAQSAAGALSSLSQAWASMDGRKRRAVMQSLILALQPIIEKGYLDPAPMHRLVSEYLQLAPADMVADAVELLSGQSLLRMVHTHEGARAGCMVAVYGTPKDRKKLVKAMKSHATKMALDEYAYVVLLAVLLAVDDTQLVRKNVIADLVEDIGDVVNSKHGCKVLLAMLHSGGTRYLPPHAREMLNPAKRMIAMRRETDRAEADNAVEGRSEPEMTEMGLSKKDDAVRRSELLGSGPGSLLVAMIDHCCQHADMLLRMPHGADLLAELCCGPVTQAVWPQAHGDLTRLHQAVAAAAGIFGVGLAQGHYTVAGSTAVQDADEAPMTGSSPDVSNMQFSGPAHQPMEPLVENYFGSRALRRMAGESTAGSSEARCAFVGELWRAFCGRCAELVDGHAGKILAALMSCGNLQVEAAVRNELQGCVHNVDEWCAAFTHSNCIKHASTKKKGRQVQAECNRVIV